MFSARRIRRRRSADRRARKRRSHSRPRGIRWFMPTGCMRPANRRCCATGTTTCSRPIRWRSGSRRPSSPPFATAISTRAARPTTKARCTCTSRPSKPLRAVNGTLPVNVKFLIEGEEEVGGESIAKYVAENPAKLKADVALVSDTELYRRRHADAVHRPARSDLHRNRSARPDARSALGHVRRRRAERRSSDSIELLAKLKDANGHIQIPGMYDDVAAPDARRKTELGHTAVRRKRVSEKRSRLDAAHRRARLLGARTRLGAAHARSPRHRRRIHRGRREDRDPGEGHRQSQHPPGARIRTRRNDRGVTRISCRRTRPRASRPKCAS